MQQLENAGKKLRGEPSLMVSDRLSAESKRLLRAFLEDNVRGTQIGLLNEEEMLAATRRLRAAFKLPEQLPHAPGGGDAMSLDPPWAVLVPGDPTRLEQRVLVALELEEDEKDRVKFEIVRGSGRYHAIIGIPEDSGVEEVIAEFLSLECAEPVYSILGSVEPAEDGSFPALVYSYRRGVSEQLHVDPQELARFLDCPFPEPPPIELEPPLKTVALVEGVPVKKALRALEKSEKAEGAPPLRKGVSASWKRPRVSSSRVDQLDWWPPIFTWRGGCLGRRCME